MLAYTMQLVVFLTFLETVCAILPYHSDPQCGGDPNARKVVCGTACRPTCANPNPVCTFQCVINGCQCEPGFILDGPNGTCIRISNCPSLQCGGDPNARKVVCGTACRPTCANPNPVCTLQCVINGCQCEPGFILDGPNGTCIRISNCPNPQCGGDPNARQVECGTACRPTCANPNPVCTLQCVINGCQCEPGFILDGPNGTCIRISDCPANLGCNGDPNSVITDCGSYCPPTCEKSSTACTAKCISPACTCKENYKLCAATGRCVLSRQCCSVCLNRAKDTIAMKFKKKYED